MVIAREHDTPPRGTPDQLHDLRALGDGLDAVSVPTNGDEGDYRELLGARGVDVFQAPHALEPLAGDPVELRSPVALAAGRLVRQKGFDLLIAAFAPVAAKYPGWTLKIFGDGPQRGSSGSRSARSA
jgi:glycosyltransferase involved in cell wall biosynthesis